MTEIPEHLLKRSRAAKGQPEGGDAGASESKAVAATDAAPAAAASGPPAIDAARAAVPADKPAPAAPPEPAYIQAAKRRKRVPMWALPLVAALPLWAISFAGTMQQPDVEDPLFVEAAEIYVACAGCHGGGGGGGTGYQLNDGSVLETFPDPIDQMVHVARGSAAISGESYGAERADGQRVAGSSGSAMPAHLTSLSLHELQMVVFHERFVLSGEEGTSEAYLEWIAELREPHEGPIDLEFLLKCANPEYTPGATGEGSDDEDNPCPGPHAEEGEEVAAG